MIGARVLPPTPAAVAAYFAQRHSTLTELTAEDARHNDRLWLVGACGLSEDEAAALLTGTPATLEAENGGSIAAEVVPASQSPNPLCIACGRAFQPRREWSRYCTVNCKQRAKRARRNVV